MSLSAYRSRRVVLPEGEQPATVVVDHDTGLIAEILPYDAPAPSAQVFDWKDDALLPGLVDPHVHINEPGRTEWEGFASATRAAAAGGITTIVDMPLNCLPETTTVAALELKRAAARGQCQVDWMPWGGVVGDAQHAGNEQHIEPLARAGVPGFKCFLLYPGCEGLGLIDEAGLRRALPHLARTGLPLLVHAELAGPCDEASGALCAVGADWTRYETYLASRPDEAEVSAVRLIISLCREFRARVHIVHVSSAQVLPLLRDAKAEGLPITAETCPHYLVFDAEQIALAEGPKTLYKCAPPIRGKANQELLWEALFDGTLDMVGSDHSPCPPAMKGLESGDFSTAWGGIAGLSLGLPVMWTELQKRGGGLDKLVAWMSASPARLAGMEHKLGAIRCGFSANLLRFRPSVARSTTSAELHFRHPISPYLGMTLTGVVQQTIVRGTTVFDDQTFPNPCFGQEVSR